MYVDKPPRVRAQVTVPGLQAMKARGERIVALTAYDYSFACLVEAAGVDFVLVGDSLGMVVQGRSTTLPVTLDEMVYHCAAVSRGLQRALLVADLPFLSDVDAASAVRSGGRLLAEGGARMVKIEGAGPRLAAIEAMAGNGIPVCAHLGLTPQAVHALGGYRTQGRDPAAARRILEQAHAVARAGASALVLECVPDELAATITAELAIPTIGIGAGPRCDGQVLVCYDMLGITPGPRPSFSRDFLADGGSVAGALAAYAQAVRAGTFPPARVDA